MNNEIEQIIRNLMSTDTDTIRKATADLQEAHKDPQTILTLCDIIVTSPEIQIRQYSAVLLSKRLGKLRNWQMVPSEQQQVIKQGILNALVREQEKPVRTAIAMFIGALVRHETESTDSWMSDLLNYIYGQCSSQDLRESELGSSIFTTLTDVAPDQFVSQMQSICEMFSATLLRVASNDNLRIPVLVNILVGMGQLTPFIIGNQVAEQTVLKSMPTLIKAMHVLAYSQDLDSFVRAFEIFDNLAEFAPKLLNNNIKQLVDFCLEISNNKQLDAQIRVQGVIFIGSLARIKKKTLVKQKMIEPILLVVFNMMCDEQDADDGDSAEFFGSDAGSNMVSSASQTLDLLALNISPEKLIPPLLQLLEPALQGQDVYCRRGAFICMAVIAEGCSEAICNKYLETMLSIIKAGITDPSPIVRNSAFYALSQFSEHLQPDISKYAPQILPVLLDFLHQLNVELKQGAPEPKHIARMFYALETFCENLENELVPHLPALMECLFDAMNSNNSVHMRELALSSIAAVATAAKSHMMPYFQELITLLQTYLVKTDDKDIISLRTQAIDTLAAIARTIGKENFLPLANDTMSFCLEILEENIDDPSGRRAVYNLIGALSGVVNENMASVFPRIMDRIIDSVISSEDFTPTYKDDEIAECKNVPSVDNDIDIEDTDDEDDDDDGVEGFHVDNDYLIEKEEAILCLKEIGTHSGAAFTPFLQKAFENVYKMIDHPQDIIRKSSIECLCSFVMVLNDLKDFEAVRKANQILIPKLIHIVRQEEEILVATHGLDNLGDLMKATREHALPAEEMYDGIFTLINDTLLKNLACQFNEPSNAGDDEDIDGSEGDEGLIEAAGNILSRFGYTMPPQNFAVYFERLYPFFLQKLKKAKKVDYMRDQRAFVYGALAECLEPLSKQTVKFFDGLFPLFMEGISDTEPKARQNAYFGLGELVLYAEDKSFEGYPRILQALSEAIAKETVPSSLDNICGAVARLIITNHILVPLTHVLPVFLKNLPLREDFSEYLIIFKCFEILSLKAGDIFAQYTEQFLAIAIHVLYKKEYLDTETCDKASSVIKQIRDDYPEKYQALANANPEVYSFVQSM